MKDKEKGIEYPQGHAPLADVGASASTDKKPNPYVLIWYRQGWSKTRIEKNNAKYWEFEIEHNGLRLP